MADKKAVYHRSPSIVSKTIGEESILVPIREDVRDLSGKVYILKGAGVRIWELVDGKTPVEGIEEAIINEFRIKPEIADKDTGPFLRQLEEKKLVIRKQ